MAAELPAPPAGADVAEYWRSLAQTKADELEAMQNDFLEFQETSQMTEEELEQNLERADKRAKTAQQQQDDMRRAKDKIDGQRQDYARQVDKLEKEMATLKEKHKKLQEQKISLEQKNDDFERDLRVVSATADEFTLKTEGLEEDKAMLGMEVEEIRERSAETEYRLREELRDLKSELQRLEAGGSAKGSAVAAVPSSSSAGDEINMRPQTVDLILQRVQQLQKHLSSCRDSVQHIVTLA